MKRVFADTSYYVAAGNPRDSLNELCMGLAARIDYPLVTTDFVLVEVGNMYHRSPDRPAFHTLMNQIRTDPFTIVVPASRQLVLDGYALFESHRDKDWSFTDCISFTVMKNEGITEALTADHHFEQAGFKALLLQT